MWAFKFYAFAIMYEFMVMQIKILVTVDPLRLQSLYKTKHFCIYHFNQKKCWYVLEKKLTDIFFNAAVTDSGSDVTIRYVLSSKKSRKRDTSEVSCSRPATLGK